MNKKEVIICVCGIILIVNGIGILLWHRIRLLRAENEYWRYTTNFYLNANYECENKFKTLTK